jgi:DNA-binding transcriptional regulator LsrR (DeoR family)
MERITMERSELLAQVATLYYDDNKTQAEIARRLETSRSTVSRLLQEARDTGIVEIMIHYPWKVNLHLSDALEAQFRMQKAIVLESLGHSYVEVLRGLGVFAARELDNMLHEDSFLGISWGTAVHSTAMGLRPAQRLPITVVQMIGAVGMGDPLIDGPDLARFLANLYGGTYRYMHAPLIVESQQVQQALLKEPRIQEALTLARRVDIALVGIGSLEPEFSSLLRAGYLDGGVLAELRGQGAVGDICARHYDVQGQALNIELNRRIVGIDLKDLQTIECVIGVAGGEAKAEAILGALRGNLVNVLVTDDQAAEKLLALEIDRNP